MPLWSRTQTFPSQTCLLQQNVFLAFLMFRIYANCCQSQKKTPPKLLRNPGFWSSTPLVLISLSSMGDICTWYFFSCKCLLLKLNTIQYHFLWVVDWRKNMIFSFFPSVLKWDNNLKISTFFNIRKKERERRRKGKTNPSPASTFFSILTRII